MALMKKTLWLVLCCFLLMSAAKAEVLLFPNSRCAHSIPASYAPVPLEEMDVQVDDGAIFTISVADAAAFFGELLRTWENSFIAAGDRVMRTHKAPLCVGIYDDHGAPNAVTYRRDSIVFGATLMLQTQHDARLPGNAAVIAMLAHEFSHILQGRHRLSARANEVQADCLSAMILRLQNQYDAETSDAMLSILAEHHQGHDSLEALKRKEAFLKGIAQAEVLISQSDTARSVTSFEMITACAGKPL